MINNKQALDLFKIGTFTETFIEYLRHNDIKEEEIQQFLKKSAQIFDCLSFKKKDIGMLVGKVQSGKTTVFSGVIAHYFDHGYDLCIILTSVENLLNVQTNDRMAQVFTAKKPNKVEVFQCDEFLIRNSSRRLEKVRDDFKHGRKYVLTILKNKQIEKVNEVLLENKIWKNRKILIIDDEADLASIGSNDAEENRYANTAIKNLLGSLTNYNYLSVTATPQAQVLINDDDTVKPQHVFTYEPGQGYMGLNEFFSNEKYFKFVDPNEWANKTPASLPKTLKQAIIHYFINISYLMIKKQAILNTTMLIHTSVAIEEHYKLMRLLIKYKNNLSFYLQQPVESLEYQTTIDDIRAVFDLCQYSELKWDNTYLTLFQKIINYTSINIINSESDDTIMENINNIVLGSRKLERGVTLDNLLLTYITNFHEGTTAVDTILQRARWFGYREKIKEFLTIYIVKNLYDQYKLFIMPSEEDLWQRLKIAEANDNFKDFAKYVTLSGKSAPTNKVRTVNNNNEKNLFYKSLIERPFEIEDYCLKLYEFFYKIPRTKIKIVNRPYTAILNMKFMDVAKMIDPRYLPELFNINDVYWNEFCKKAIDMPTVVLFCDDAGENNFRERTRENDRYQLFEGPSEDSFPGEKALYKISGMHNKLIFSIHKIKDKRDQQIRYYIALHLPKDHDFSGVFYTK